MVTVYTCLKIYLYYHLSFWSGNLFLIAPFPDLCLLVPFYLFLSTMLYSLACFIMGLLNMLQIHEFVYT